jgi:large subunit ribosomal protein L4
MATVTVLSQDGKTAATLEVSPEIFDQPTNANLYYESVKATRAAARQGNATAKTRAEVRGGKSHKPWKQKGTGRARAGSLVSPLWRGGGVIFPPMLRDYGVRLPKKVRRGAIFSALSEALRGDRLKVVSSVDFPEGKTKQMATLLTALGCSGKTLFLYDAASEALAARAARNIATVKVSHFGRLNIVELLDADAIVLSRGTLEKLQGVWKL